MGRTGQFEDLLAWQKARTLTSQIYQITRQSGLAHDYGLTDQMRRAAVSIMSNIAEGFERGSKRDFRNFLVIAKASCGGLCSQLYVALDADYITHSQFDDLRSLAVEVSRILSGLRRSIHD